MTSLDRPSGVLIRKLTAVLAAVTFAALATAPFAKAEGCASKAEFKKVERGMSRARVAGIFDTDGKLQFRSGQFMSRTYKTCARYATVSIDYKSGFVTKRFGFWA